jgi:hypothetical protein
MNPKATRIIVAISAVALAVALVGCASLQDRARSELDRLDAAAMLDRFLEEIAPADPSEPADPSAPAPSHPGDEIDLASVVWHGPDVRAWPVTSELQPPVVSGSTIRMPHSKAGQWPVSSINGTAVDSNPWIIARIDGRWHAASWEWLRPGQVDKPWAKIEGGHIKTAPFDGWALSRGEECYAIVSALARGSARTVAERTAARRVVWQ